MYKGLRVAALIAAAGSGLRMGGGVPKQFMRLDGKTMLEISVEAFASSVFVDDVLIVADKDRITDCESIFSWLRADPFGAGTSVPTDSARDGASGNVAALKLRAFVPGGSSRQESVRAGLKALDHGTGIVLIHDAARPLVSVACIDRVIRATAERGAATAAVPVTDTLKSVAGGIFVSTIEREGLYAAQTPQGFKRDLILEAHESAFLDGFVGTDDAVLAERIGAEVCCVEGESYNFKITVPDDIIKAEALLARRGGHMAGLGADDVPKTRAGGAGSAGSARAAAGFRVGTGFDAHRFTEGRPLVLGGVSVPYGKGLLGHSDADVLVHALIDALLGAAALGDIGKLFPDSDPAYKGISSIRLLESVAGRLDEEGWEPTNADVTVIAEAPRLAAYIPQMRDNLAAAMGIDPAAVSVKATTTEGMGFTGAGLGVAAQAVVMLRVK
jgi:2-C-methyl-D-erythritol 4-phosphate cytidylyltransferase/2-C-methyl-D-erythritol 2,4-cyclodiphosphate synthase